jgi:hypothetical protein
VNSSDDPVDHTRTERPRAGKKMDDTRNLPSLVLLVVALTALVFSLVAFGSHHHGVGLSFAGVALVTFAASMAWRAVENRRLRRTEDRWFAEHPDVRRQRPST